MKGRQTKAEKGITLVALVVTIMILVIISAIIIRGLTGHDGLIDTTLTASEEHTIASYKEILGQKTQEVILGNMTKGKETTLSEIAEAVKEEEWVIKAEPDEANKLVIVVTKEGYVFQIYYDGAYGRLEIECTGKENEEQLKAPYPEITAKYVQKVTSIFASASVKEGSIAKIEILYKNEVIKTFDNPTRRDTI